MSLHGARKTEVSGCDVVVLAALLLLPLSAAIGQAQDGGTGRQAFEIKSSVGDLHLGNDADAREIGLPVYPGARLRKHDNDGNSANLALLTSEFGFKLVVANYDSDDAPSKIIAYYRAKLRKYGKVVECHTSRHGDDVIPRTDGNDSGRSKELSCEGDNAGDVLELKAGTEDNQHIVAVEPAEKGGGSTFAMVYVHTRGKQADI